MSTMPRRDNRLDQWLQSFAARLTRSEPLPPSRARVTLLGAVAAVFAIGALDYATGSYLSLNLFYLLPTALVAIRVGADRGTAIAVLSAVVSFSADALADHEAGHLAVTAVNSALRLVILVVVVALLAALRKALDTSRLAGKRTRDFLGMAAHQLRTPLSGIVTTAEALVLQGADPDSEPLLANLASESHRAGRVVTSMLRVTRLDEGEPLPADVVDLVALCEEEAARARRTFPGLAIVVRGCRDQVTTAVANAESAHEIIAILLDNAHRFAVSSIDLTVSARAGWITVEVTDDGPGVPPGAEELVFERFVSLDSGGGTGLGLAIARGLAQVQGGDVVYRDRHFEVLLPAAVS